MDITTVEIVDVQQMLKEHEAVYLQNKPISKMRVLCKHLRAGRAGKGMFHTLKEYNCQSSVTPILTETTVLVYTLLGLL